MEFIPKDSEIPSPFPDGKKPLTVPFKGKDVVNKAGDTGRVRLLTSVDSEGDVQMITRKSYYNAQSDRYDKNWEMAQMVGTAWGQAIAAMSVAGGFKNRSLETWENTLTALVANLDVIKTAQLVAKDRAFRKMRRFAQKRSFMDRELKRLFKPVLKDGKRMNLGIGAAGFAPTGPGEMSVPTTSFTKNINRIQKVIWLSKTERLGERVREFGLDEFRSTCCCHRCGERMALLLTRGSHECRRYRVCLGCPSNKTVYKIRHRDVNAARNILKVLECHVAGAPRPEYMRRPAQNQNVGLPQIEELL